MKQHYIASEKDYYYCSYCSKVKQENIWHQVSYDTSKVGFNHLKYLNINKSNEPDAKLFYCSKCKAWHYTAKSLGCLPYRQKLQKAKNHDSWIKKPQIPKKQTKTTNRCIEITQFDGVFWFNKQDYLNKISPFTLREKCIDLLNNIAKLYDEYKVQIFYRINVFSFIVKGLKIAELSISPPNYNITLEENIFSNKGISVNKSRKEFEFKDLSNSTIIDHFKNEAENIISLRTNNKIGYIEKWLHSLLIEKMKCDKFNDLEYLYYEAPGGKKGSGRTHIDILAKNILNEGLVVIEVKKDNQDLNEAICQGLSYLDWVRKNEHEIQRRTNQLNWNVKVSENELMIITPDLFSKNDIDEKVRNHIGRYNFNVEVISVDSNWRFNEELFVTNKFKV